MVSSVATQRKIFLVLFVFLFCAGFSSSPKRDRSFYESFRANLTKPCREKLSSLDDLVRFLKDSELQPSFISQRGFAQNIKPWSSDLLLKLILDLEVQLGYICSDSKKQVDFLAGQLKSAYLQKLGCSRIPDSELDSWFRAFLVMGNEFEELRLKIQAKYRPGISLGKLTQTIFGWHTEFNAMAVVAPRKVDLSLLAGVLRDVCESSTGCEFGNSGLIYKIVVRSEAVAAYIPEIGVLILSEAMLRKANVFHKVVLLHELVHVAQQSRLLHFGKGWEKEFFAFSGWKRKGIGKWSHSGKLTKVKVSDPLTRSALNSPFSSGVNHAYLSVEKGIDGFVLGKALEQSVQANDPSEDLADHVAVFRYFPQRFCVRSKSVAPQKLKWIRANFFPKAKSPSCR